MKQSLLITLFFLLLTINNKSIAQEYNYSIACLTGKELSKFQNPTNRLHKEAYRSFLAMQKEAAKDNIQIQIVSGYRSFNRQLQIFNRKYTRYQKQGLSKIQILNKITEYSTIPGTSRHHWGTDIDIIQKISNPPKNLLVAKNYEEAGVFCNMKEWMDKNAHKYGFDLVYTNDTNRTGFKYEPWHYSYAPIAKKLLTQFIQYETHNAIYKDLKKSKIKMDSLFFKKYLKTHIYNTDNEYINN